MKSRAQRFTKSSERRTHGPCALAAGRSAGPSPSSTSSPHQGLGCPASKGLRAVAACSVLIYHCWRYSSSDHVSPRFGTFTMSHLASDVILFFALSGFLLYRPFAAAIVPDVAAPSVSAYLRNRALPILPTYRVILRFTGIMLQAALLREGCPRFGSARLLSSRRPLRRTSSWSRATIHPHC